MARSWHMEVGAIPPASLRGNSRAHHMVKYREGRDWRESGEMHAYVAAPGVHHVEKIRITGIHREHPFDGVMRIFSSS